MEQTGSERFHVNAAACVGKTLAPEEDCAITVEHKPGFFGKPTHTGQLQIFHEAAGSPTRIPLSWTRPQPASPPLVAEPSSLDFGVAATGPMENLASSVLREVEIRNNSDRAFRQITAQPGLSGDARAFTVSSNGCEGGLAPGQSCRITVTFAPKQAKTYHASLVVMPDGLAGMLTVSLSGGGQAPPPPEVKPGDTPIL